MSAVEHSVVRDPSLAAEGKKKIAWVEQHMPILGEIRRRFRERRPFAGRRVGICLHLEAKTAYLAYVLSEAGADVAITGSNPLSTQDDVAAGLADMGVRVFSWYGATAEEYDQFVDRVVSTRPQLLIDDGGDMVAKLHTGRRDVLGEVIGGCEETTTGVIRLKAMEAEGVLAFPMVAVNDAYMKYLFDNRYGTGQSVWDGIMRTTNLVVSGKTVVVVGYGWCGKGVARRAEGLGARVIVCEVDPIVANEALMDGFRVMPMADAAPLGDFFVSVTGCNNVIRGEHVQKMKDGAVLANAGHFDVEISKPGLESVSTSKREVRKNITAYELQDGRRVYLLAEGRLVNLAAGDGHPAEVMDMSFAVQALALQYINKHAGELKPGVINVTRQLDVPRRSRVADTYDRTGSGQA